MKTRRFALLSAFVFLATSLAYADESPVAKINWIFLNTGADREKTKTMTKEELSKMQADHVGNFGTQFNLGKLFAAGPLGDNGFIRGIVILNAETPQQVAECFKLDP